MPARAEIATGYDGDLTLVDLARRETITGGWLAAKCGWSPFEGRQVTGWPVATLIRGHWVMRDGELIGPADRPPDPLPGDTGNVTAARAALTPVAWLPIAANPVTPETA